jgi:CDP-diacylglycerol--glycerol-3-phosphate 3-phosphatidyltransferase
MSDKLIDKIFLRFIPHPVQPNLVTAIRLFLVPVVYFLLATRMTSMALAVFIIAISTDFIDGAMARTRNQITDLGKVIDPIADKLLILVILLRFGGHSSVVELFSIFIVGEIVVVLAGYLLQAQFGKPVGSNVFGKIKLVLQSFVVGFMMLGVLLKSKPLVDISMYLLAVAFLFAIAAGVEVARRKLKKMEVI